MQSNAYGTIYVVPFVNIVIVDIILIFFVLKLDFFVPSLGVD
jgi:hypothetical protein